MNKAELRRLYLEKRAALPIEVAAELSQRIAARFFSELDLTLVHRLHTFIRIRRLNEIDTSYIYFKLWRDFQSIATYAPRIDGSRTDLKSVRFSEKTELRENNWEIREPVGEETIEAADLDLVLVPLLCFDTRGHRLGYGQGFYDRMLAHCRPDCLKVGLSYFPPLARIDDTQVHDVPLDLCITPEELFRF